MAKKKSLVQTLGAVGATLEVVPSVGMTVEEQLKAVDAMLKKQPEFEKAAVACLGAIQTGVDTFRHMIVQLHKTDWNKEQRTLVMLHLGFRKERVSEWVRISLLPESQFEPYRAGAIGYKLALESARRSAPASAGSLAMPKEWTQELTGVFEAWKPADTNRRRTRFTFENSNGLVFVVQVRRKAKK